MPFQNLGAKRDWKKREHNDWHNRKTTMNSEEIKQDCIARLRQLADEMESGAAAIKFRRIGCNHPITKIEDSVVSYERTESIDITWTTDNHNLANFRWRSFDSNDEMTSSGKGVELAPDGDIQITIKTRLATGQTVMLSVDNYTGANKSTYYGDTMPRVVP